jgi:propionyl-CoA carboxylase alpha chain
VVRESARVVRLGEREVELAIAREGEAQLVHFAAEKKGQNKGHRLVSSWKPGDLLWSGSYDGRAIAVQVRPALNGFDLAHRGAEVRAFAYTEREAAAARLMPVKRVADSGKALRCPMPGVVRAIAVTEGQEVKAGETLAVVEAMKMENVLRAERDGVVKSIKVRVGDSLAVDAVIIEFA